MTDWQGFYDGIAHGDKDHRAWLRGFIEGWAAKEGEPLTLRETGPTTESERGA